MLQEAAQQSAERALQQEKERAAASLASEIEGMRQERQMSEEALEGKHAAATADAAAAHQRQVTGLEGKLEEANGRIAEMGRKIEGLELEMDSLRKDIRQRDAEMVEEKDRASKQLKEEQSRLKKERKDEVDSMLEEHLEETKSLHQEFSQVC